MPYPLVGPTSVELVVSRRWPTRNALCVDIRNYAIKNQRDVAGDGVEIPWDHWNDIVEDKWAHIIDAIADPAKRPATWDYPLASTEKFDNIVRVEVITHYHYTGLDIRLWSKRKGEEHYTPQKEGVRIDGRAVQKLERLHREKLVPDRLYYINTRGAHQEQDPQW